jgi:hypothetical protein
MVHGIQFDIVPMGGEGRTTFLFSLPLSFFLSSSTTRVEKEGGGGD